MLKANFKFNDIRVIADKVKKKKNSRLQHAKSLKIYTLYSCCFTRFQKTFSIFNGGLN